MSQAELARRINVSRGTMGQIERGRVKWPPVDVFNAIARELGVPVTRLLRAAGAEIPADPGELLTWVTGRKAELERGDNDA